MGAFSIVAEGGSYKIDREEVRRAAGVLFSPGEWHELRALPSGRGKVVAGGDLDAIVEAAAGLSDESVYYCLNPIAKDAERASKRTVTGRKWLPLDIDTVRPKDVSATEAEKAKSAEVAHAIACYLDDLGWPGPVMLDSGNGWHLLYRVELPNDDLTAQLIKKATYKLAEKFDSQFGKVDRATHDAPRVFKLPGTCARKGPDTADRPWRMARLAYEPESIEPVSLDQIRKLIDEPKESAPESSPFSSRAHDGDGLTSYIRSAINQECGKIALSVERNNALNSAAFSLGTMAAWPEMAEAEAKSALHRAAVLSGLDRDPGCGLKGIAATIHSGWEAGRKTPRQRPVEARQPAPEITMSDDDLVVGLDQIVPEKVDWFWEDRVAPGFISLFAGRTGMGKSFVTCDYVARTSRGEAGPFSEVAPRRLRTLFISEDPPSIMLGPRLLECNANALMIKFMRFEAMSVWTLANLKMLETAWLKSGKPEQIVIDPPSNFLGDIDEHKNAALRGLLMPLVAWLDKNRVACVMITHLNKQTGKGIDAVGRIMGSVAWASTARVTLAFDKDPDVKGQNLVGGSKNNLGQLAETLAFKVVKTETLARIEWVGKASIGADEMVNQIPKKSKGVNAVEWLIGIFRQRREWESDEIRRMAKENGISKYALFESPEVLALPIAKRKRINANGEQYWMWIADEGWPSESSECRNLGRVDPVKDRESEIPKGDSEGGREEINRIFTPY